MANFGWLNQWSDAGAKKGHSPFDLTKKMCFGLPNSLLVPIKFIDTVPDDHLQIDLQGLVRTETLNTAAFYQGKVEFEVFFVPYKQLWHNFNQFVVKKEDKHSTVYKNSAYAPNVKLSELMTFVLGCYEQRVVDEFGYPVAYHFAKLLQHAKICNMWPVLELYSQDAQKTLSFVAKFEDRYVNIWRILAYQHIFYDRYRNKYYDDMPLYQPSDADDAPINYIDTFNLDNIDCGTFANSHILSWNNAEHQDIEFNNDFTFDYAPQAFYANLLSLHYAPYRKDLYTSLLPSSQFGAVASVDIAKDIKITVGSGGNITTSDDDGRWSDDQGRDLPQGAMFADEDHLMVSDGGQNTSVIHRHVVNISNTDGSISIPNAFDVLSMRRAELLQGWKQNALRAGNMVDANFRSHYGVEPYYEDDNNVKFLGSYVANIDLNPVTATASTGGATNGSVGDLAAFGVGKLQGRMIDFNCKDFGTIVVVAHVASEVYYSANGCDKQNTMIEPFDYFQSEFQDAGLDVVELSQQSLFVTDELSTALGYTPPYTCYKTDVDEVFDQYADAYININQASIESNWVGSMNAWTVRRSDYNVVTTPDGSYVSEGLPISRFYQSPGLTDSIFGVNYDGQNCPFGVALAVNTKAIRPMSILGIPIFS